MYRHGDVLIAAVESIPTNAIEQPRTVLAYGEITGHSHRIAEAGTARVWMHKGQMYLEVIAPTATLIHEEHAAIPLPRGQYRVWMQREYTPTEIRRIVD